jgi:cytochrome P450
MVVSPEISRTVVDPKAYADGRIDQAFATLRKEAPIALIQAEGYLPFWAVTRHADILEVERRTEEFHNGDRPTLTTVEAQKRAAESGFAMPRTLIQMDGPEHLAYRRLTQAWFMPANLRNLEPRIRELARGYIGKMAALGGECDFARDVALFYPLRVIMEILGVPEPDEPLMLKLTQEMFGADDEEMNRAGASVDKLAASEGLRAAVMDFVRYFNEMIEDRKANPRDDLASVVANGEIDGKPLGFMEVLGYYLITATAGHDTTSNTTATSMWILAERPDLLRELKADPSLIPAFIEDSVRWATSVKHFMRTATRDTEVAGQKIAKGDWLMLCYHSGNRDETAFERPFEFDIRRGQNKHVAFGHGPHVCLGQHLGRMEMRIFWEELLPRLESVELAGKPANSNAVFVSGPKHVPIRYKMN